MLSARYYESALTDRFVWIDFEQITDFLNAIFKWDVRDSDAGTKPGGLGERKSWWERLDAEAEGGVRGRWAYGLLQDSSKEEVQLWTRWIGDANWSVRWCVSEFLARYPEFPKLEKTFDPELIAEKALPVLRWYEQHKRESGSALSTSMR